MDVEKNKRINKILSRTESPMELVYD